jgi:hypothetical protein
MKKKLKSIVLVALSLKFVMLVCAQKSILEDRNKLENFLNQKKAWGMRVLIGKSQKGNPIYGYYFNRNGKERAMVIAGVHGSEFYGVSIAKALIDSLKALKVDSFKWKLLIVPSLFADNVQKGLEKKFVVNYGRTTCDKCNGENTNCKVCQDPNRQMPKMDKLFKPTDSISYVRRKIELENRYLLYLTQVFNPMRIASLHCKNKGKSQEIGIFADPKTNNKDTALGFEEDSALAVNLALYVEKLGGVVKGNFKKETINGEIILSHYNAVYPQDSPAVKVGEFQKRTYHKKEKGISFGTWASTEIVKKGKLLKQAAIMLTFEIPQYHYFFPGNKYTNRGFRKMKINTEAYVSALRDIFLEYRVE